jgi:ParB/RepB/Spo0J family partition protein
MGQWKDVFKPEYVAAKHIEVEGRYRRDLGDIDALAKSIDEIGLLQPLIVRQLGEDRYKLIAGYRRLQALIKLGRKNVAVRIAEELRDAVEMLRAERDENTCRKDFTPREAVAIGKAIEELEKPKAKERQSEGGKKAGKGRPATEKTGGGNLPQPNGDTGKTRDKVAEAVGMSGRTYEKAKRVVEAAEKEPEKHAETVKEMDRTGKVDAAYKKVQPSQSKANGETVAEKAKHDAEARQFFFDSLSKFVDWTTKWIADIGDDYLAWYSEPGTPGSKTALTAKQLEGAISQL